MPMDREKHQTNNTAELLAVITGLRPFNTVVTDSEYAYMGATLRPARNLGQHSLSATW